MIAGALTVFGVALAAYVLIRVGILSIRVQYDGHTLFDSDRLK